MKCVEDVLNALGGDVCSSRGLHLTKFAKPQSTLYKVLRS